MELICHPGRLCGEVRVPGSKSHTIRAIAIAALAPGTSEIRVPLDSADARSARATYAALGAQFTDEPRLWRVQGTDGQLLVPANVIDVGNSGTTLRLALGSAAMLDAGMAILTGDKQIRRRTAAPLVQALNGLGANVSSAPGNGCAPFVVGGHLRGGEVSIEAVSSQFLSSLLINTPLADNATDIHVTLLNEAPYVMMTLDWLRRQGIRVDASDDLREFHVPGSQRYRPVELRDSRRFLLGHVLPVCGRTGCQRHHLPGSGHERHAGRQGGGRIPAGHGSAGAGGGGRHSRIGQAVLRGCEIDLNATPDALPMMAVLACFAMGQTRLVNVPQARMKETDRIAVMAHELARMGAQVKELKDGLIIHESPLRSARVHGHDDHRVVMALAVAGLMATGGETAVETAEAMEVTYPGFVSDMQQSGAQLELLA